MQRSQVNHSGYCMVNLLNNEKTLHVAHGAYLWIALWFPEMISLEWADHCGRAV
jgi:hypothetical protein